MAAVAFADDHGIASLSMRRLGDVLGVEAMSLYNHVANKDELLDGMVDLVFSEIDLPSAPDDWKTAMGKRAQSARQALGGIHGRSPSFRREPRRGPQRCSTTTPSSEAFG